MIKMKEIPKSERPRERMMKYGPEQLNNEELLTILLGSGTPKGTVREIASSILKETNGLMHLEELGMEQLLGIDGIGVAKACILLASLELGKRAHIEELENKTIDHAELVYHYYHERLEKKKQEYFYCIYLDQKKKMIKDKLLFIGTLNQSLVHPREIFKEACILSASSIICVHNHPSGQVLPSREDYELTKRLVATGRMMGIPVVDHIIIGKVHYYSFFEHNDL